MASPGPRRWEAVYEHLKTAIDQQKYQPGEQIPPERDLMESHNVSRNTVRSALSRLENEGLVTSYASSQGRLVRDYRPLYWHLSRYEVGDRRDDPDTGVDEWAADMRDQGRTPVQQVTVAKLPAPSDVAEHLGVQVGTWLVRRHRIRWADDEPVTIADTWLPEDIAHRTCDVPGHGVVAPFLLEEDIALPGGILAAIGVHQTVANDLVMARMPSTDEAQTLRLSASGTPVGHHVRVGIDTNGRPVRALLSTFPGDRLYLRYQLKFANNTTPTE